MKKKSLILFIFAVALIFIGCGKNELTEYYEKMQTGKGLDSYQLDLRIYGTYNDKGINEIVKIDNYKGKQYKINYVSNSNDREPSKDRGEEDNIIYLIDGTAYLLDEKGSYKKTKEEVLYAKPEVYLEGLKNLNKDNYLREEEIVSNKYKVYGITVAKKDMENILKNSALSALNINEDVNGEVWLDKDGFTYKILYNINTITEDSNVSLTINASYFRINTISEIKSQLNIK